MNGVGFAQQLAASCLQGLVGLLVCGDLDAGGGVKSRTVPSDTLVNASQR